MHVRKFESETIEGALKEVKRELGPDAIILKTVTNKGMKGAFKKNKIEVTVAISEKDYVKKARVDQALTNEQRDQFYQGSSSHISNMIDRHDESTHLNSRTEVKYNGYGKVALNKPVQQVKQLGQKVKDGLDEFLSLGTKEDGYVEDTPSPKQYERSTRAQTESHSFDQLLEENVAESKSDVHYSVKEVSLANEKIDLLEKKIFELSSVVSRFETKEPTGIYQLRSNLSALDINDNYIREISKKAIFELSDEDVENSDIVFEFALRNMLDEVHTSMPLFSETAKNRPVVTVLLSESSCGQTSLAYKIAALNKNMRIVSNGSQLAGGHGHFTEKILNLNCLHVESIAEIVSECRKAVEGNQHIIVDYRVGGAEKDETKKFIDGLRRSFQDVEVFVTLSAIHSELYNKRMIGKYKTLSEGLVFSYLDQCLNYGSLFNLSIEVPELPLKFFGTGEEVPNDIESASAERILAGIFQL